MKKDMLIPKTNVSKHQLWAWTPENQKKVCESLKDPRSSIVVETKEDVEKIMNRWTNGIKRPIQK